MIGLSTTTFNLDGFFVLHPSPMSEDIRKIEKRVSRNATLDGGASVVDMGYASADRTFRFDIARLERAAVVKLQQAISLYSEFVLTTEEGAFFVVPQSFDYRRGLVSLTLLSKGVA